jgi:hypothetical protein
MLSIGVLVVVVEVVVEAVLVVLMLVEAGTVPVVVGPTTGVEVAGPVAWVIGPIVGAGVEVHALTNSDPSAATDTTPSHGRRASRGAERRSKANPAR